MNVLCAPPNGRNPGMASVDMAFASVARHLDGDVTYWRLWDQSEWLDPPGGSRAVSDGEFFDETSQMTYRVARGHLDEFLDAEAVVFWGDFHHMAVYQDQTADVLHRRMGAMSRSRAEEVTAAHLLLRGQPDDVLKRTITFGTTLGFNTTADYAGTYSHDLSRFLRDVAGAWFRDGYSARIAELIRAPRIESCLGADAAFLVHGPMQDPSSSSGVGVFIGRSNVAPEFVARLGRALAFHFGPARWIPWGTAPAMWPMWGRKRLRLSWPELEAGRALSMRERASHAQSVVQGPALDNEVVPASDLFERIAGCSVLLTDTYHLAVNAWRIGVPAILLVDRAGGSGWNVNSGGPAGRDKRHDLYSQLDALPLLVSTEKIPSGRSFEELIHAVSDLQEPVRDRCRAIGDHARRRVIDVLSQMLTAH